MSTDHEAFETFCLALTLELGSPKGLGPAMQRRSTMVGGKKVLPIPVEDLTTSDILLIASRARVAGIAGVDDEEAARQLYARYAEWYAAHRR